MDKTLKIVFIVIITTILLLGVGYQIRISDDIYRHYKIFNWININNSLFYYVEYFYRNFGNFIFYVFIYISKKHTKSLLVVQLLIAFFYYLSGYLNLNIKQLKEKEKIILLIFLCLIINPFYILTILHYPLSIIFLNFAIFCNNKKIKKLEILLLILSYLTHNGVIYILVIYLLSKLKIIEKIIYNKKTTFVLIIIFLFIKELFMLKFLELIKMKFNNVYLNSKIDSYFFVETTSTLSGGMGKMGLFCILYFIFMSIVAYFGLKRHQKNQILTFYLLLLFISIILATFNMTFLVRSTFVLTSIYPYLYSSLDKKNRRVQFVFIVLSILFIIEYRFLLNIY